MTISDLNIQDDKMIIQCDVGIFLGWYADPRKIHQALHNSFDETTLRVYGKQLIFYISYCMIHTQKCEKFTIYFKLMQGLLD